MTRITILTADTALCHYPGAQAVHERLPGCCASGARRLTGVKAADVKDIQLVRKDTSNPAGDAITPRTLTAISG